MVVPKNRIRLSRSLHAQTTPYPEAGRLIKRSLMLFIVILIVGIYLLAKPEHPKDASPSPKQILGEQESSTSPEYQIYEVKKGDTLFNLSQKYEVSWQTLAEINRLEEPYILRVGQKLKVPAN